MLSMTSAVARHCISPRCWCAPTAGLVQLVARRPHSVDGTECGRREYGCTRPAVGAYQHRSACSAHGTLTQAPRGVVPEPGTRATGRVLCSAGHGHRVLSIPVQRGRSTTRPTPSRLRLHGYAFTACTRQRSLVSVRRPLSPRHASRLSDELLRRSCRYAERPSHTREGGVWRLNNSCGVWRRVADHTIERAERARLEQPLCARRDAPGLPATPTYGPTGALAPRDPPARSGGG